MLSLLAIVAFFVGLLLIPVVPAIGSGLALAGAVTAGRAVFRQDDLGFLLGVGLIIAMCFGLWQFICFLAP